MRKGRDGTQARTSVEHFADTKIFFRKEAKMEKNKSRGSNGSFEEPAVSIAVELLGYRL